MYAVVQLSAHKTESHIQQAFSWDNVELAQEYHVFIWGAETLVLKTVWGNWEGDVVSYFWESSLGALAIDGNWNQTFWIVLFVHSRKKGWFLPLDLENILSWRMTEASFISNFLTAQFVLQKSVRAKGK